MDKNAWNRLHTAVFILVYSVLTIVAFFNFSWLGLKVGLIIWFIANCPGVGVGFHRLLTHRGFETPKWVEYTLTVLGCLALQGSPIRWVAIHRMHHKYVEQPGKDPHTPREGFSWAQWTWMMLPNLALDGMILEKYAPDLTRDKYHRIIAKIWWAPSIIVGVILFFVGSDWSLFLWGAIVPVFVGWQITWSVNSVTHMIGSRRYDTPDDSTNNRWVAFFTFGEGWHNNHHAFPTSARHGLAWHEWDMNYYLIRILQLFWLAKNLKLASLKDQYR